MVDVRITEGAAALAARRARGRRRTGRGRRHLSAPEADPPETDRGGRAPSTAVGRHPAVLAEHHQSADESHRRDCQRHRDQSRPRRSLAARRRQTAAWPAWGRGCRRRAPARRSSAHARGRRAAPDQPSRVDAAQTRAAPGSVPDRAGRLGSAPIRPAIGPPCETRVEFYNLKRERLRPRAEPHHRAARPARPVRVRARADRADAAGFPRPAARARAKSPSSRPATAPNSTSAPTRVAGRAGGRLAGRRRRRRQPDPARPRLRAGRRRGGAPCLPRRQRPRLDGARRAADPRPDEAGGARGRARPARSARRCTRCSSARSRSPRKCARSTEIGAHSISMAAAAVRLAVAAVRGPARDQGAVRRRRRDDRAGRDPFRGPHAAGDGRGEPHPRARREARRRASAPRRCGWPTCRRGWREFDVVVSCTASSLPIIGLGAVERALKLRKHRPMFMVDLAVPRDIEPEVARAGRRLPLHGRRPVRAGADGRRKAPGGGRAGRGDHRGRRAELRALARPARRRCR